MRLGIKEIRNIVRIIKERYGDDFSDYAMPPFKRRLEQFIARKKYNSLLDFIEALRANESVYKNLLYFLAVPDTEMFRDPNMWIYLKDTILPSLSRKNSNIWIAGSNSGEELFSFAITYKESDIKVNDNILCTTNNSKSLDKVKSGVFDTAIMEINKTNYKKYNQNGIFSEYFENTDKMATFNQSLTQDFTFETINLLEDSLPKDIDLMLYRNQMLYFNRTLQHKILENIHKALVPGGYFIIGSKESIESFNIYNSFIPIYREEGIYKKAKT